MEDCPDPLAVVSPESSNHRMIGSVTPRIVKIIGAPGQAKNNEKDEVVSTRPYRLKVIQNKGCQTVKVSPGSSSTLSKVLLSKEALDTRLNHPSLWQKQVYIRKIKNYNLNYVPIKPKKKVKSVTDHLSNKTRIHCCKLCDFATKYLQSFQIHFKKKHKPIESRSEGDIYEYIEYQRDNEQSLIMLPPGDPGFKVINEHGEILKRNLKCKYCGHKAERINLMRSHLEEDHRELHEYEGGLGYTVRYADSGKRCKMPPVEFIDENKEMALIENQALSNNVEEENQKSCENDLIIRSEIMIKEEPIDVDDFKRIAKGEPRELKSTSEDKEYLHEEELMEEEPDPLA